MLDQINPFKNTQEQKKPLEQEDYEITYHLIQQEINDLVEQKKNGIITKDQLLELRKPLDAKLDYQRLSKFKQDELIHAFNFEGDEINRSKIIEMIQNQPSIAEGGSNHQGVFEIPDNKIVKVLSSANYAYELPMVKLTQNLVGNNLVKTYDVFERDNLLYVVQDKAAGKEILKYSDEEINNISQEHYDALVQLVNMYAAHGIATDPSKVSNLFYDPEKGFTVIDLGAVTYQCGLDYHIDGYFTHKLSQEKINQAVERFGEFHLTPVIPTLEDKLKKMGV